jgi:general secretion pathway protein C
MLLRGLTFGVWAAVAASAVHWGLKLWVVSPTLPQAVTVADASPALRGDLSRLLGPDAPVAAAAAAPEPTADARFSLIGVLSPKPTQAAREGVALIAVDGKPAKAFRIGAVVDGQNVLQSVDARGASLGPRGGASLVALRLTPPAAANSSKLPPGANSNGIPNPAPVLSTVQAAPVQPDQGIAPSALPPSLPPGQPPMGRPPGQPRDPASAR